MGNAHNRFKLIWKQRVRCFHLIHQSRKLILIFSTAQSNAKEEAAAEEEDDVLQFIQRHVGVVEQSGVALLSGTIAFNIGYGKVRDSSITD